MANLSINRRSFLKNTKNLFIGTLLFTSGPVALLAPSRSWALELRGFGSNTAQQLLHLLKNIYPHPNMEDAVYAFAIQALDEEAYQSTSFWKLLDDGVQAMVQQFGQNWYTKPKYTLDNILKSIQNTHFFNTVRIKSIRPLYGNELAYHHFGYEGASFMKGGYIHRGFNDLVWLPDPPPEASPPITQVN